MAYLYICLFQLTASQGGWQIIIVTNRNFHVFQLTASQGGWLGGIWVPTSWYLFQLTASQGGWLDDPQAVASDFTFQLTASQGGWHFCIEINFKTVHFNSQPHKEADEPCEQVDVEFSVFQLTASQGGWRTTACFFVHAINHFNSQPHKEADFRFFLSHSLKFYISTHSLTRRLTVFCKEETSGRLIFQLTASQGGWPAGDLLFSVNQTISTHSLTRRLTFANGKGFYGL